MLTEQYRLLKTKSNEPGRKTATSWPPPARATHAGKFDRSDRPRQRSMWRRVKAVLLGTPEPVLEDSL